jgi:hypothetical protein
VEDTISILWTKIESQSEELEDEYLCEEFEDTFDTQQPVPKESKFYQSSFELEDMASPYGGRKRDVRQFSSAAGTIKVEDFKREFTI